MNKKEEVKNRVNFLYYEESLTQKEIGELLSISRQRVSAILNSNEDHKIRKTKRRTNRPIYRNVQLHFVKNNETL